MADQKISELTAATSAASADLLTIVQGGTNKKLTVENFLGNLNSPVVFNQVQNPANDVQFRGDNDVNTLFVDASTNRVGFGTNTPSEKADVAGNLAISGGFLRHNQTPEVITGSGSNIAVDLTKAISVVSVDGTSSLSIAAGVAGQIKYLVSTAAQTVTITPTNRNGYASIGFNAAGDSVVLLWLAGAWHIVGGNSYTLN
jgi:hypothetical protein